MRKCTTLLLLALTGASALAQEAPQSRPRTLAVLPIPSYPVQRRTGELSIDGRLTEWPRTMPGMLLGHELQLSGTAHGSWKNRADFSAGGMLLWDEGWLYVALQVADDWPRPTPPRDVPVGGSLPPGDGFTLSFDPNRDSRSHGRDRGRAEDREYWVGMSTKGRTLLAVRNRLQPDRQLATKAVAALTYDKQQGGYTLELAIPWKELLPGDLRPAEGLAIDCQVVLEDYDDPLDVLPQTRIGWTFGSGPRIDPMIWGTLVLCGKHWDSDKAPPIPAHPEAEPGLPPAARFVEQAEALDGTPQKGGMLEGRRGELLRALDHHMREYPRLDYEQLLVLGQRRMRREYGGYQTRDVPLFLELRMAKVADFVDASHEAARPSLCRLPGRGWLVRSKELLIGLSPAGPLSEENRLALRLDALFLARALDPLDRWDPLAFRMLALRKPVLTHVAFHCPGFAEGMKAENLTPIGTRLELGKGVRARILGRTGEQGAVSAAAGIELVWPDGLVLVAPSLSGTPDQLDLPEGKHIDLLILDPDNAEAGAFAARAKGGTIVLEGFLDADRFRPGRMPRSHRLDRIEAVQKAFGELGARLVLLAPGEVLDL